MQTIATWCLDRILDRRVFFGVFVLALTIGTANGDEFPDRALRIIAPISAGGPSDTAARLAAVALSRQLKQNVIVENRTGAGGVVGTEAARTAPADGYTLLESIAATFSVIPTAKAVSYDPEKDFIPLGQIWSAPQAFVVSSSSRFKTVAELVAYARDNPGGVTFGSAGVGTTTHLSILLLQQAAGITVTHVPYRGTINSVADIMAGNIDAAFGDVSNVLPFIEAGKLTVLATTGPERTPLLPNVPTMKEVGLRGVVTVNWYGLHVSSKTPAEVVAILKAAVRAVQDDPEFKAALAKNGTSTGTAGADAFAILIHEERERLAPIVQKLDLE
jgi:tripartite-type tricarboxylate transporter receptor subunit TctC